MQLRIAAAAAAVIGAVVPVVGVAAPEACAAGEQRVVVVVDFGSDGKDRPATKPAGTCIPLTNGMSGADALLARARALGTEPPRYESSGLLCAIDGYPETGCGERDGAGFMYWTYWKSDANEWAFGDEGPATHKQSTGTVTGWRFQRGTGSGLTENPPRTSAAFADLCAAKAAAGTPTAQAASPSATSSPRSGARTSPKVQVASANGEPPAAAAAVDSTPVTIGATPTTVKLAVEPFDGGSGSPAKTIASIGALAAVGCAFALWFRRQRGNTSAGNG